MLCFVTWVLSMFILSEVFSDRFDFSLNFWGSGRESVMLGIRSVFLSWVLLISLSFSDVYGHGTGLSKGGGEIMITVNDLWTVRRGLLYRVRTKRNFAWLVYISVAVREGRTYMEGCVTNTYHRDLIMRVGDSTTETTKEEVESRKIRKLDIHRRDV